MQHCVQLTLWGDLRASRGPILRKRFVPCLIGGWLESDRRTFTDARATLCADLHLVSDTNKIVSYGRWSAKPCHLI